MKLLQKFTKMDRAMKWLVAIIVVGGLLRLALALYYTPSGDACWHSSVARYIGETGSIPDFEHLGRGGFARTPLFHILGGMLLGLWSFLQLPNPNLAIHLINPIFGVLTLIFVYKLALFVADRRTAIGAVAFMAVIPLHLYSSYIQYLDGPITFFVVAASYYILQGRLVMAGIMGGLGSLTNISFLGAVPLFAALLWYGRQGKGTTFSGFFRKASWFFGITALIGLPWYIRNWIIFENPVWPWFRFLIGGIEISHDVLPINEFGLLINPLMIFVSMFLGLYGVPDGDVGVLTFFNVPFLVPLLVLWAAAGIIFLAPVFLAHKKLFLKKHYITVFVIGIVGYLVYMIGTSTIVSGRTFMRYALPAVPFIAILWGAGMHQLWRKLGTSKFNLVIIGFALIGSGFVLTETGKTYLASSAWSFYDDDFAWVQENTPADSLFMANGQCFSYHFHRQSLTAPDANVQAPITAKGVDYVWVNQEFRLHNGRYTEENVDFFEKSYKLAYENPSTATKIYRVE